MATMRNKIDCPLTGKEVTCNDGNTIGYELTIAENKVEIFLCRDCYHKMKKMNFSNHIICGLIANKRWPEWSFVRLKECTYSDQNPHLLENSITLPEFLETAVYPKTPKEKMEHFFLNLFRGQKIDGEEQEIDLTNEKIYVKNYFKTPKECEFYYQGLRELEWIEYQYKGAFKITHAGLNAAVELLREGKNSNKCFIAMAFKVETKEYREAIKKALTKTDFEPIIIDEEHLASDKTIPDGILAGIKQAKFCIADFTYNRAGVYFESGYALGLGKPVIYLCKKEDFPNVHFDVKQLQHIIYQDAAELEKRLVEKIEAWIKE